MSVKTIKMELPEEFKQTLKQEENRKTDRKIEKQIPQGSTPEIQFLVNIWLSKKIKNADFLIPTQEQLGNEIDFQETELSIRLFNDNKTRVNIQRRNIDLVFNFIKKSKKQFVVIFLGIEVYPTINSTETNVAHSNLLIYNKKSGILERFEPDVVDPDLDNRINNVVKKQFIENGLEVNKFIKPMKTCPRLQVIEEQERSKEIIQNKIKGVSNESVFCFYWSVIYLLERIKPENFKKTQEQVVNEIIEKIKKNKKSVSRFIREFSIDIGKITKTLKLNNNKRLNYNIRTNMTYTEQQLKKMKVVELKKISKKLKIKVSGKGKKKLIEEILMKQGDNTNEEVIDTQEEQFVKEIDNLDEKKLNKQEKKFVEKMEKVGDKVISGEINPFEDTKKVIEKLEKKRDLTPIEKAALIQKRIDISIINILGLGKIKVGDKELGNPSHYGQPPFTKTEKTLIEGLKVLNPLTVLEKDSVLGKGLGLLKGVFGGNRNNRTSYTEIEGFFKEVKTRKNMENTLFTSVDNFIRTELKGGGLETEWKKIDRPTKELIVQDIMNNLNGQDFETMNTSNKRRLVSGGIGYVVYGV